ncbi:hypothetical protein RFI_00787 [Reticulomyxa filosa]|uniref:Uncharacterized protein n=1 Tax=Reticulomyxa filosa TaxID=46433 RepID=X6PDY4_RETFI|nr:hypothetical protein RFI_00787 [Reticulomyxa filosa]|eukprot:ETO36274.1 hypothetical protein RFI_00787 [Reticulomyxa filosa]
MLGHRGQSFNNLLLLFFIKKKKIRTIFTFTKKSLKNKIFFIYNILHKSKTKSVQQGTTRKFFITINVYESVNHNNHFERKGLVLGLILRKKNPKINTTTSFVQLTLVNCQRVAEFILCLLTNFEKSAKTSKELFFKKFVN